MPDVAVAFLNTTPLAAAPECLLSFDDWDLAAPPLADGGSAHLQRSRSADLQAAVCLASPGLLEGLQEENAGTILRARAAELGSQREAELQSRWVQGRRRHAVHGCSGEAGRGGAGGK